MPDVLRIVTFSTGGRPIETLNLNSAPGAVTAYFRDRDGGFQFVPAVAAVQYSKRSRRWGGARATGATHDNGTIGWTVYVRGTTLLAATQNVEALLQAIEDEARGRYVEWAPEGGSSSYLEIAGPGTWAPAYNPVEFVQTNAMRVQLTFPVLPLVQWSRMGVNDPFALDTTTDYTFDAMTSASIAITGGSMQGAGILTTERRAIYSARGYNHIEGKTEVGFTVGTTLTSFKVGVIFNRIAADTYLESYIDDTGAVSRIRIDKVVVGVRTNLVSLNLTARLVISTVYTLRSYRIDNLITAEVFTGTFPQPFSTAANATSIGIAGGDITTFVAGKFGFSWIPQQAGARLDDFDFRPLFLRPGTPGKSLTRDTIPGSAPALCDVTVSVDSSAAAPVFALIGWCERNVTPIAGGAPFGLYSFNGDVTNNVNLTQTASGGAFNGFYMGDATVSGVESYTISRLIDPSCIPADDFSDGTLTVEVWMRAQFASTVVSPRIVLSARSADGTAFGAERFTNEWGSAGELLTQVAGGSFQFYRLGTIALPTPLNYADVPNSPQSRRTIKLWLALTTGSGSTGTLALDYLVVLPVRSRCLSPTGKPLNSAYPSFISSTSPTTKTVRADLSAVASSATAGASGMADHGLGGALIEVSPGINDWFCYLGTQVPDDSTAAAVAQLIVNNAALMMDYTPRSFMLRSS